MIFKKRNILYYSLFFLLIALFVFLDLSFFIFKPSFPKNYENYKLNDETVSPENVDYDFIQKGNLKKYIRFESIINRENDDIEIFYVPNNKNIICKIDSIVNIPQDISLEYEVNNFKKGRVLNIEKTSDYYLISIDLCSNYFCTTAIPSSYYKYVKDISNNTRKLTITNKIDNSKLDYDFTSFYFDKEKENFVFKSQLNSLSSKIYNSLKTETAYLIDEYINQFYIDFRCLKDIDNMNIGTFEHIIDIEKGIIEEINLTVTGIVDNFLIVESNSFLGEKFKKQNYSLSYNLLSQFY